MDEFAVALEHMNIRLSHVELKKLVSKFDADRTGTVDYSEFMEKFGNLLQGSTAGGAAFDMQKAHGDVSGRSYRGHQAHVRVQGHHTQREALYDENMAEEVLLSKIGERWGDVHSAFRGMDKDRSATISTDELAQLLGSMNIKTSPSALRKLLAKYDVDNSGGIDYHEFVKRFGSILGAGDGTSAVSQAVAKKQMNGSRTPLHERQIARHRATDAMMRRPATSHSVRSGASGSRPTTGDWVHTARSVRSLQAQVRRNIPFIRSRMDDIDPHQSGRVKAEDFVVALVDAGVDIGSQMELKNLAGNYSDGNGPTANVQWKAFLDATCHRNDQNKKQSSLA